MSRRRGHFIHYPDLEHVKITVSDDGKKLSLALRATEKPLPRVTLITELDNIVMFQFSLFSWNSLVYPPELLNWVIIDNGSRLDTSIFEGDPRVRVVQLEGKYDKVIEKVMEMPWVDLPPKEEAPKEEAPKEEAPKEEAPKEEAVRPHVFSSLACGDVVYPDTLALKYRAMVQFKKDCVCPDSLAFYNPVGNVSVVMKLYREYPRSGLYWKKSWWNMKNTSKAVGMGYIGNCVKIGNPLEVQGYPQPSSIRFFETFPDPVKQILRGILDSLVARQDSHDDK